MIARHCHSCKHKQEDGKVDVLYQCSCLQVALELGPPQQWFSVQFKEERFSCVCQYMLIFVSRVRSSLLLCFQAHSRSLVYWINQG